MVLFVYILITLLFSSLLSFRLNSEQSESQERRTKVLLTNSVAKNQQPIRLYPLYWHLQLERWSVTNTPQGSQHFMRLTQLRRKAHIFRSISLIVQSARDMTNWTHPELVEIVRNAASRRGRAPLEWIRRLNNSRSVLYIVPCIPTCT